MKLYTHSFDCSDMIAPVNTSWSFYPYDKYSYKDMCFFDIETTGLSAATSSIYMIGAGHYENDKFIVLQWFADNYNSEEAIINAFLEHISGYRVLLQYNGNTFDLPYIKSKCKTYHISCGRMNDMVHIDLYSSLRKYAAMLNLPNKKLISFEKYIGLNRDDKYNGGELIHVYSEYMQNRYLGGDNDKLLDMLLLHNYEDITGLSQVASLMFLTSLDKLNLELTSAEIDKKCIKCEFACTLPGEFMFSFNIPCFHDAHSPSEHAETSSASLTNMTNTTAAATSYIPYIACDFNGNTILLTIPIISTTLNYYFTDYKDYYYMINEGTIMHKSVAIYADASVRRKARKAECFVSKTGKYIPVIKHGCFSSEHRIFRSNYTAKEYFIEYSEDMLSNRKWLEEYYRQLF